MFVLLSALVMLSSALGLSDETATADLPLRSWARAYPELEASRLRFLGGWTPGRSAPQMIPADRKLTSFIARLKEGAAQDIYRSIASDKKQYADSQGRKSFANLYPYYENVEAGWAQGYGGNTGQYLLRPYNDALESVRKTLEQLEANNRLAQSHFYTFFPPFAYSPFIWPNFWPYGLLPPPTGGPWQRPVVPFWPPQIPLAAPHVVKNGTFTEAGLNGAYLVGTFGGGGGGHQPGGGTFVAATLADDPPRTATAPTDKPSTPTTRTIDPVEVEESTVDDVLEMKSQ